VERASRHSKETSGFDRAIDHGTGEAVTTTDWKGLKASITVLGFFRDFARKKGPLAGQHTQEVETLLPSPLFFRDLCG